MPIANKRAGKAMNTLIWIGQIALAATFLISGASKLFAGNRMAHLETAGRTGSIPVVSAQGSMIGLIEMLCALGVIMPISLTPDPMAAGFLLVRTSAASLALLMCGSAVRHLRRRESAAPSLVALLLALFVIVGRWPY
jgi:hypothetical protein